MPGHIYPPTSSSQTAVTHLLVDDCTTTLLLSFFVLVRDGKMLCRGVVPGMSTSLSSGFSGGKKSYIYARLRRAIQDEGEGIPK